MLLQLSESAETMNSTTWNSTFSVTLLLQAITLVTHVVELDLDLAVHVDLAPDTEWQVVETAIVAPADTVAAQELVELPDATIADPAVERQMVVVQRVALLMDVDLMECDDRRCCEHPIHLNSICWLEFDSLSSTKTSSFEPQPLVITPTT